MTKELTDRIALEPLIGSGWSMVEGRDALTKEFKFESFRQAWAWMSEIGAGLTHYKHDGSRTSAGIRFNTAKQNKREEGRIIVHNQ